MYAVRSFSVITRRRAASRSPVGLGMVRVCRSEPSGAAIRARGRRCETRADRVCGCRRCILSERERRRLMICRGWQVLMGREGGGTGGQLRAFDFSSSVHTRSTGSTTLLTDRPMCDQELKDRLTEAQVLLLLFHILVFCPSSCPSRHSSTSSAFF
jgi:hypothetical protein